MLGASAKKATHHRPSRAASFGFVSAAPTSGGRLASVRAASALASPRGVSESSSQPVPIQTETNISAPIPNVFIACSLVWCGWAPVRRVHHLLAAAGFGLTNNRSNVPAIRVIN